MPVCKKCGKEFPSSMKIEGVRRGLNKRSNCLECSPFKTQNERKKITKKTCSNCNKKFQGYPKRKFCSNECQVEFNWKNKIELFQDGKLGKVGPKSLKGIVLRANGHKCSICYNSEWMGNSIPLVLDHIDGNPHNDFPDNLRLVCGNCDMQLPTYKSKNKGNGRHNRRIRYAQGKSY